MPSRSPSSWPSRDTELLYGRQAVREALRGPRISRRLLIQSGASQQQAIMHDIINEAGRLRLPVHEVDKQELARILPGINHQGVALETGPFRYTSLDRLIDDADGRPLLLLDQVQDPQNLGTLIRTAEATGCAGLVVPEHRAASVTPAVVNASAGAVEHLPVARVVNTGRAVERAKERGYWAVGLALGAERRSIFTSDLPEPVLLIVGAEGRGISPGLVRHLDLTVEIPMFGRIDSLNAAVAGSIALYELVRRRLADSGDSQDSGFNEG